MEGIYSVHWKPLGTFLEQALRIKLRETGILRLMPKTLALIAVQRHIAASMSIRPSRREQHGDTWGEPTVTLTKPSTLAHTPNLRKSIGQLPCADGVEVRLEPEEEQDGQVALTREKKRMMSAKRRVMEADRFEAILSFSQNPSGNCFLCFRVKK
ncbi:transmembrane protein [Gossypium australe]|uniref:Transmembrane protein n=1 Tax=Gossypium australe TaxID=47621 RepID=A0A5B6W3M7_9ROSI|nr:transmembrane protein [Gossypium australe]